MRVHCVIKNFGWSYKKPFCESKMSQTSAFGSLSDIPNVLTSLIQSTTNETLFSEVASHEMDINKYAIVGTVATIVTTAYGHDLWKKNQSKKQTLYNKRYQHKLDLINMQNSNYRNLNIIADELNTMQTKIRETEDKIFKFDNVQIKKTEKEIKFIVTIGNTQHGKSTLCNRLCGDKSRKGDKGPFMAKRCATSGNYDIKIVFVINIYYIYIYYMISMYSDSTYPTS